MRFPGCRLIFKLGQQRPEFESEDVDNVGKLIPKDDKTYNILLHTDNPDINSLTTEIRLIRQALKEYKKRLPYNFKVYLIGTMPYPMTLDNIDVIIDFIEPDNYMTQNTLAYAGYPFGSLRGQMKFNNKFIWWDGSDISAEEALRLGLVDNAEPGTMLRTYNVRQTVKHEFGHILGLEHDFDGVMEAIYSYFNNMLSTGSLHVLERKYGLRSIGSRWLQWIRRVMTRRL